jgi:hypothetical protein
MKENALDEDDLRDITNNLATLNDEYKNIAFDTSSEDTDSDNGVDSDY